MRCTEIEIGREKRKRTSQRSHDKAEAGNALPFTRFVLLCEKNRLLVKFIEQSVGGSENRDSSSLPFRLPQDSNDVYVYDAYFYVVACVESRDSIHWPIVHFLFSTPLCFFFILFFFVHVSFRFVEHSKMLVSLLFFFCQFVESLVFDLEQNKV